MATINDPYKIQIGDDEQEPAGRTYEESFEQKAQRNSERLSKIERDRKLSSHAEPAPLSPGADAGRQEDDDESWVRDMETLAGNDYGAKRALADARRDGKLNPQQAKQKTLEDKADQEWTDKMLKLGGQK